MIILIGHQMNVGKDTVAQYLRRTRGFSVYHFADKLKQTVADLYNFSEEQMYTQEGKMTPDPRYPDRSDFGRECFTPRRILQLFGQQQRSIDPNIWVRYVMNQIEQTGTDLCHVIPDFRFRNEYDFTQSFCDKHDIPLVTVKIERDNSTSDKECSDISEKDLKYFEFDVIIKNDSTIDDLYKKVEDQILLKYLPPRKPCQQN